jgi:hypothetical protein
VRLLRAAPRLPVAVNAIVTRLIRLFEVTAATRCLAEVLEGVADPDRITRNFVSAIFNSERAELLYPAIVGEQIANLKLKARLRDAPRVGEQRRVPAATWFRCGCPAFIKQIT